MEISLNNDRQNHSVIQSYCHMNMNDRRHAKVGQLLNELKITSIIDLGCADGTLLSKMCHIPHLVRLIGVDIGEDEVKKACLSVRPSSIQSDIQYEREEDQHIYIYKADASKKYRIFKESQPMFVSLVDVIEHLHDHVLQKVVENVFGYLRPKHCFISTPNAEFNQHFMFVEGQMRHPDHLFQWNRNQFGQFCKNIQEKYGYSYETNGIGEHVTDLSLGHVTQYAVFTCRDILEPPKVFNDEQQQQVPEQRCHVINQFWFNNMDTIMRQFLYKILYLNNKITFQQALIKLQTQYIWEPLQKAGIIPTKQFLIEYLEKTKEDFTWDETTFYRYFGPESDSQQQELYYENSYNFQIQFGPNYNEDLSNSNTELVKKRKQFEGEIET